MQQKLVELTKQLVRIPSVSSDIQKLHHIVEYVKWLFCAYPDAEVQLLSYNTKPCLIVQNFHGKHADIMFSGHLDVVPPSEDGQFEPYEEEGRLYGRWCSDMKDGCAIIITLMQELLASGYDDKNIALRLTTDEEVGWHDGMGALVADGRSADVALIPDSGSLDQITIASKGIVTMKLHVQGKSAHSSRPWRGDNALEKAYGLYQAIKWIIEQPDLLTEEHKYRGTTVQLTEINGWVAVNVTPGDARMTLNIRHTESYTANSIRDLVEPLLEKWATEMVVRSESNIIITPESHPMVQTYKQIVEEEVGHVELNKEHGSTDGSKLPTSTTIILHQPADAHIHGEGEYTTISELEKVYTVYKRFVLES